LDICKYCDNFIIEKLNNIYKKLSKGVYLPSCLSINSVIAHNTFTENNDYQLKDNDIVSVGETIKVNK
jgi:methionine aminopeptidase